MPAKYRHMHQSNWIISMERIEKIFETTRYRTVCRTNRICIKTSHSWFMSASHRWHIPSVKLKKLDPIRNLYLYLEPNDPCFDWKRLCFGGLTFKNKGYLGSRYILYEINNISTLSSPRIKNKKTLSLTQPPRHTHTYIYIIYIYILTY